MATEDNVSIPGFNLVRVTGDGHCLYYSILPYLSNFLDSLHQRISVMRESDLINEGIAFNSEVARFILHLRSIPRDEHNNTLYNVLLIRNIVAKELRDNWESYKGKFLTKMEVDNTSVSERAVVEEHAKLVATTNEWADDADIVACMRVFGRRIAVLDKGNDVINKSYFINNKNPRDQEFLKDSGGSPIYVFYNGEDHYNSLIPLDENQAKQILDNLLFLTYSEMCLLAAAGFVGGAQVIGGIVLSVTFPGAGQVIGPAMVMGGVQSLGYSFAVEDKKFSFTDFSKNSAVGGAVGLVTGGTGVGIQSGLNYFGGTALPWIYQFGSKIAGNIFSGALTKKVGVETEAILNRKNPRYKKPKLGPREYIAAAAAAVSGSIASDLAGYVGSAATESFPNLIPKPSNNLGSELLRVSAKTAGGAAAGATASVATEITANAVTGKKNSFAKLKRAATSGALIGGAHALVNELTNNFMVKPKEVLIKIITKDGELLVNVKDIQSVEGTATGQVVIHKKDGNTVTYTTDKVNEIQESINNTKLTNEYANSLYDQAREKARRIGAGNDPRVIGEFLDQMLTENSCDPSRSGDYLDTMLNAMTGHRWHRHVPARILEQLEFNQEYKQKLIRQETAREVEKIEHILSDQFDPTQPVPAKAQQPADPPEQITNIKDLVTTSESYGDQQVDYLADQLCKHFGDPSLKGFFKKMLVQSKYKYSESHHSTQESSHNPVDPGETHTQNISTFSYDRKNQDDTYWAYCKTIQVILNSNEEIKQPHNHVAEGLKCLASEGFYLSTDGSNLYLGTNNIHNLFSVSLKPTEAEPIFTKDTSSGDTQAYPPQSEASGDVPFQTNGNASSTSTGEAAAIANAGDPIIAASLLSFLNPSDTLPPNLPRPAQVAVPLRLPDQQTPNAAANIGDQTNKGVKRTYEKSTLVDPKPKPWLSFFQPEQRPHTMVPDAHQPGTSLQNPQLGNLTMQSETGRSTAADASRVISSGKNDPGGVSYGTYQISTDAGTMSAFFKYCLTHDSASSLVKGFEGLEPKTAAFNQEWRRMSENPDFLQLTHSFIFDTHFTPLATHAVSCGITQTDAINEALFSMSVQHSGAGAKKIINSAIQNNPSIISNANEVVVLTELYKAREDYVNGLTSLSEVMKQSISTRYKNELASLTNSLSTPRLQPM